MTPPDPYRHAPHDAESAREMRRVLVEHFSAEEKLRRNLVGARGCLAAILLAGMMALGFWASHLEARLYEAETANRAAQAAACGMIGPPEPMRPGLSLVVGGNSTATWTGGTVSGVGAAAFGWECVDKSQAITVRMTKSEATCSSADAGAGDGGAP